MRPSALALVLVCALGLVPAGASSTASTDDDETLLVNWSGPSDDGFTLIAVDSSDGMAKVTLSAPAAYTLKLNQPRGTRLGFMNAFVWEVAGRSPAAAGGPLIVDDQAPYVSDSAAQACDPGRHAAVWSTKLSALGQPLRLPIFVDRVHPDGASGAVLRFCPIWPMPAGGGVTAEHVMFWVEGVFSRLTARGRNTWSALVSPPLPTLAPDESGTFELRALEPVPHEVTLRARHVPKRKTVVLSGKITAAGQPEQGDEVWFGVLTESATKIPFIGPAKTNASGEFSFRHRVKETTAYFTSVFVPPRPCAEPSVAPAGCIRETVSNPPLGPVAIARVRRPTDARLVVRSRDQALARRVSLTFADLPPGWKAIDTFSLLSCRGFRPKLSTLTATGDFESVLFERSDASASSRATVYVSKRQARTAFAREARLEAARCLADKSGYGVRRLREIPFAALGEQTRAFRVFLEDGESRWNLDLVSFRQGRAVVHLGFESVALPVEEAAAAKVAARARRG